MKPFLQLKEVTLLYPQQPPVISKFSLDLMPGNVYALIGDNGSGKSTLLKAICGLFPINSGSIIRDECHKIGYVPEQCNPPHWLTIYRFMYYNAQLLQFSKAHAAREIEKLLIAVQLLNHQNILIAHCSKGMRQRLCIAQALLGSPEIVILDEPFSGLDKTSNTIINKLCFQPLNNQLVIFSCHEEPRNRLSDFNIFLTDNYHSIKRK
jgi:ABC-2 type transport system ATP-binding protein